MSNALSSLGFYKLGTMSDSWVRGLKEEVPTLVTNWSGRQGFYSTMNEEDASFKKNVQARLSAMMEDWLAEHFPAHRLLLISLVVKFPQGDQIVGLHRDWAYVDETKHNSLNFWIPLEDVDEQRGCLHVVEGSHHSASPFRGTPFVSMPKHLEETIMQGAEALPMTKGEVLVYDSRLLHFSNPCSGDKPRIAIAGVIIPSEAQPIHYCFDEGQCVTYDARGDFFSSLTPGKPITAPILSTENDIAKVSHYYDRVNHEYMQHYGEHIQAFRPTEDSVLFNHMVESMKLSEGLQVVDAGCGVGGSMRALADRVKAHFKGFTLSSVQLEEGRLKNQKHSAKECLEIHYGDYHYLDQLVAKESVDRVLFIESLGHSTQLHRAVQSAEAILKPGGILYIKDFFPFYRKDEDLRRRQEEVIERINEYYAYNVIDFEHLMQCLRKEGLRILTIQAFPFEDDITKRFAFEEALDIDLFESKAEFRVAEWLEIVVQKPINPMY